VVIETRISWPTSITTEPKREWQGKVDSTIRALEQPGEKAEIATTILVIVAVLDVAGTIERLYKVPDKDLVVVTLDREDFRRLIGPTLYARPQFVANLAERGLVIETPSPAPESPNLGV